jgi:hypothetical protein
VKRILNLQEESAQLRLSKISDEYGASVHTKMRVADVLPIEQQSVDSRLFSFALRSHFDFLVAENLVPIFAVEVDGPLHSSAKQRERDEAKLALCRQFSFPLLRINAGYLPRTFRTYDLLTWCAEYWFLQRSIEEAELPGDVGWEACLDPVTVLSLPDRAGSFPMWISTEPRIAIQELAKVGYCEVAPSEWIGFDDKGVYRGMAWIKLANDRYVFARAESHAYNFHIGSELVEEILPYELLGSLKLAGVNPNAGVPWEMIFSAVRSLATKHRMACASGSGVHITTIRPA